MKKLSSLFLLLFVVSSLHALLMRKIVLRDPRSGKLIKLYCDMHAAGTPEERTAQFEVIQQKLREISRAGEKCVKVVLECEPDAKKNAWDMSTRMMLGDMCQRQFEILEKERSGESSRASDENIKLLRYCLEEVKHLNPKTALLAALKDELHISPESLLLVRLGWFAGIGELENVSVVGVDERIKFDKNWLGFMGITFANESHLRSSAFAPATEAAFVAATKTAEEFVRPSMEQGSFCVICTWIEDQIQKLEGFARESSSAVLRGIYQLEIEKLREKLVFFKNKYGRVMDVPFSAFATKCAYDILHKLYSKVPADLQSNVLAMRDSISSIMRREMGEASVSSGEDAWSDGFAAGVYEDIECLYTGDVLARLVDCCAFHCFYQDESSDDEVVFFLGAKHGERLSRDFQELGCTLVSDSKIKNRDGVVYESYEDYMGSVMGLDFQIKLALLMGDEEAQMSVNKAAVKKLLLSVQPLPPSEFEDL